MKILHHTESVILNTEPEPRYRHIALALRAYVSRERISLADLGRQLGGSTTVAHKWTKGHSGISPAFRPKVARLLGVPVEFLAPWNGEGEPPDMTSTAEAPRTELGPARTARALMARETPQAVLGAPQPVLGSRLSYEGHGDGTATISVRARLPLAQAKPLFRLLLDSGIDLEEAESHG